MKIGDKVKWNDSVHGPSTGEVVLPDSDGTDMTLVAMDTLADGKPVVAVDSSKFIVEVKPEEPEPKSKKTGK